MQIFNIIIFFKFLYFNYKLISQIKKIDSQQILHVFKVNYFYFKLSEINYYYQDQ